MQKLATKLNGAQYVRYFDLTDMWDLFYSVDNRIQTAVLRALLSRSQDGQPAVSNTTYY